MVLLVRRAEPGDQRSLTSLVSKAGGPTKFRKIFGSYNFGQMIETSYLSVSALSTPDSRDDSPSPLPGKPNETIVGFATLSDSPRAGTSEDWLEWFSETHAPVDTEVTMTNTLWMDFAVAVSTRAVEVGAGGSSTKVEHTAEQDEEDAAKVIENIVRTVFNTLPELDYLVMSLPGSGSDASGGGGGSGRKGGIATPSFLLSTFEVLGRHANASPNNLDEAFGQPLLLLCDRMAFLPTLAVRPACVEDHDDLMPVFAAQSDLLSATYGEFFLADMIELQDSSNKALAALVQGHACGLLATSSDLELGLLQDCFQLDDYDYLVKMPRDTQPKGTPGHDRQPEGVEGGDGGGSDFGPPRILLLGPPGAGKTTLAVAMAAKYGIPLVSADAEAKTAADSGSEQGERAMKLLDAGEVLPDDLVLRLVSPKLSSTDCQKRGWVLEGIGAAVGVDELKNAVVMAAEVPMADGPTASRPSLVIVLDLPSEADVLERVAGRRVDSSTGNIYHESFRPPPDGGCNADGVVGDASSGDGNPAAVTARLESYQARCDAVVRTFATRGSSQPKSGKGEGGEGETASVPQEGVIAFVRSQPGGAVGRVLVLDAKDSIESILVQGCSAVDEHMAAADGRTAGAARDPGSNGDGGSVSPATLSELPSNAFAVTLFCLESRLESRAADFLPHAFLMYPDRDYCVLTLPTVGAESVLLRNFSTVPARPGSAFNHVLYVMHRDSLPAFKYMRVSRFLGSSHRAGVSHLVEHWGGADQIMAAVKDADQHQCQDLADNPPSAAFVATMGRQVVGVFVASREACGGDEIVRIRSEFEVEDFVSFDRHRPRNQALLTALVLNPIFSGHCRFALKEVMRLYDKSVIYWRSTPRAALPASVPWHMIPLRPRHHRQPQEGEVERSYTGGGGKERMDYEPAALYFLSRRFLTEPKVTANRRVVIVGASSTAVACLEGLVFTPYLNFTSLTLVSPNGIPSPNAAKMETPGNYGSGGEIHRKEVAATGGETKTPGPSLTEDGVEDGRDTRRDRGRGARLAPHDEDAPDAPRFARMSLERHVRTVRSRMVHLDRENGAILLPNGSVVPYDILVLCTGLQDDTSRRLGLWAPGLNPSAPEVPGFVSLDSPSLHADVEENLASTSPDSRVVVYAGALKGLCAAQGLIDWGVDPGRITLVRPLSPGVSQAAPRAPTIHGNAARGSWSLGNASVDIAVAEAAVATGINDAGYRLLEGVRLNAEGGIAAANFADLGAGSGGRSEGGTQDGGMHPSVSAAAGAATKGEYAMGETGENRDDDDTEGANQGDALTCGVLLCGDTPNVDPDVFRAVNNSGLVYDGRLVVDPMFRTSDPTILAGGTLTKYSRVHGACAPRHENYNAREVGTHLAACVLHQTDPLSLVDGNVSDSSRYTDSAIQEGGRGGGNPFGTSSRGFGVQPLPLPRFGKPRCISGTLPGGLRYVRATLPPTDESWKKVGSGDGQSDRGDKEEDAVEREDGGKADERGAIKCFATGEVIYSSGNGRDRGGDAKEESAKGVGGFCLVRADPLDRLCDIIYCGQGAVEARNLSKLVGVQLGYLQGMEAAFERGDVSDWVEFFRQGALTPLCHDRFPKLTEELRETLSNGDEAAANLLSVLDKGINEGKADEWLALTTRNVVGPGARELPPSTRKTVEGRALEWVRRNRGMLPRLALPPPSAHTAGGGVGGGSGVAGGKART